MNETFQYEENQEISKDIKTTKKKQKINDKNFYKNLPIEFFSNEIFERIAIKPMDNNSEPEENIELTDLYNEAIQSPEYEHHYIKTLTDASDIYNEAEPDDQQTYNYHTPETRNIQTENRTEYLMKNLNLDNCSQEEVKALEEILGKYNQTFQIPGDKFRHTDITTHRINLIPGTNPVTIRQFRIPEHHKGEIQKQLNELEEKGIISKCQSPWNSPIFLVPKKENEQGEKQYRLVIDYRALHKVIEPTAYPIPLIDEIIDQMQGSQLFTTLDLYGAYHQIPLDEESKQYTAFSTSWEKYCFNSVPFGLVSSPYAWLKTIHCVLQGLIGKNVFVYMDDIIIFAQTLEQHLQILSNVLERLLKYHLKLKIDKSKFLKRSVTYLGFIITTEGLKTDPKKIEGINKFPQPNNVKNIQSFMGMCNYYRRYIKNYAHLAKPLYNLCKKDSEFVWNEKCESAFQEFKQILTNSPILIYPNFSEQFILHTDASNDAVGAVSSQGTIPHDKPIHYFSETLNTAQTRYSTIEKKLLAIIMSVENFTYYLTGREFLIVTDHRRQKHKCKTT